ncbi:Myb/SANT-like DNA-binding domain-containing protein 4 [Merluccius polli]|uniref:Myb/SANT-like DNA-binding domain-containing protein 4 n=1 Tax=Merluccius polli TaxID=89951 RepID=A0AA47MK78_MERPO|nr:Myb/SANT-like DNA-binding domain-containing protein 4 [Merluccius polli]
MEDAKRSKTFSRQELEVLVEEIITKKKLLLGRFDNITVTAENKKRGWAKVAQTVSAVGFARDGPAVKKKWADIKSIVKKKAAERSRELKRTGGGKSSIQLDALEEKILGAIGETLVGGVEGGVDTGHDDSINKQLQTGAILLAHSGRPAAHVDRPTSDDDKVPKKRKKKKHRRRGGRAVQPRGAQKSCSACGRAGAGKLSERVRLPSPEGDLTISQLISDTFYTPATHTTTHTEDMVSLQRELLHEVKLLRRVQEQLLQVEREKLLIEREKLRLKQATFDLKNKEF